MKILGVNAGTKSSEGDGQTGWLSQTDQAGHGYAPQGYGPQGGVPSAPPPVYSQEPYRNEKTPAPGAYNQYQQHQQTPSQSGSQAWQ